MTLRPDSPSAVDFLHRWAPAGPWVLTAIRPDKKDIRTRAFGPSTLDGLKEYLAEFNGQWNIYFSVNPVIDLEAKKAARTNIRELAWLHVDVDPRAGEDLETERARCLALFTERLPAGVPPPTVIIFSGGGYQGFWRLEQPFHVGGDLPKAEEAKRWNLQLETLFGGDHCHNVDRIMRLPGTINIPDDVKRKKGRVAARAELVAFNDTIYPLGLFTPAPVVQLKGDSSFGGSGNVKVSGNIQRVGDMSELEQWNVPDRVKVIIVQGRHPNEPKEGDNSRSMWVFDVVCNLVRCNVPDAVILGILTDSAWAISESILDKRGNAERYAVRQIERAKEHVELGGLEFQKDHHDRIIANPNNIRVAMLQMGVSVSFDEFKGQYLIAGLPSFGPKLTDPALVRLRLEMETRFFRTKVPKEFFADVVMDAARRATFHPVRDYLDARVWDGQPRIANWLVTYAGADDTPYTRAVGELLLVAAVRRVRTPGCKFDEMVVLESAQGTNKSSALAVLAVRAEWFTDNLPLNADSREYIERTSGFWIIEACELSGMSKSEVADLKATLSRQYDRARMSYDRLVTERARDSVIVATTNDDRYLKDPTGNRRFWPICVEGFDLEALERDRDQLWAEAATREAEGRSIRLHPDLWPLAAQAQEDRTLDDPFVDTLRDRIGEANGKVWANVPWEILGLDPAHRTPLLQDRIGKAMRKLGFRRKRLRNDGRPTYCYVRGEEDERAEVIPQQARAAAQPPF